MQFSNLFMTLLSTGSLVTAAVVASDRTQVDPRSPDHEELAARYVSRPVDCEHAEIYDLCAADNISDCGNIHPIAAMNCASVCNACCKDDCDYHL